MSHEKGYHHLFPPHGVRYHHGRIRTRSCANISLCASCGRHAWEPVVLSSQCLHPEQAQPPAAAASPSPSSSTLLQLPWPACRVCVCVSRQVGRHDREAAPSPDHPPLLFYFSPSLHSFLPFSPCFSPQVVDFCSLTTENIAAIPKIGGGSHTVGLKGR